MDNGKVALHADDHQNKYWCRIAERVHELVHAAEELAEDPAKKSVREERKNIIALDAITIWWTSTLINFSRKCNSTYIIN